jgi:hypothetical protein
MTVERMPTIADIKTNIIRKHEDQRWEARAEFEKSSLADNTLGDSEIDARKNYYMAFGNLGGVFKTNEVFKEKMIDKLKSMDDKDIFLLSIKMTLPFTPKLDGTIEKNKNEEFSTMKNAMNFVNEKLEILNNITYESKEEKKANSNVDDISKMIFKDLLTILKDTQMKEQEQNYIALGQKNNNG